MTNTISTTLRRVLAILMSFLIIASSIPVSMLMATQEAFAADTISVTLKKGGTLMSYGGSGLAYKYTVNVNGTDRPAYCLQPSEVPPDVGSRKASAMADSSKVAQTMYYCYGYPGQKKLQTWLNNNGYSNYSSGNKFYVLSHVMLSYAYDSSTAFVGWSNGYANTTINKSYQNMVKAAYNYVKSLDDPAGFSSEISFSSNNGSTSDAKWTEELEFKSSNIKLIGHEDNYVTYKVPSDMTLHMGGKEYAGGTKVTIEGGSTFYLTSKSIDRANKTYTSPTLTGNLQDYTAYKITDSGSQNMAFFAVNKGDTASFKVKFGPVSAKIRIHKIDKETGKQIPQAGVTFDVLDAAGNKVATDVKTDAKGEALTKAFEPGTYYVTEVKAPTGYTIVTDKAEVKITAADCAKGEISYTRSDPPQKGIINIEKYGDYINNAGNKDEELLPNIKFRIIAAEDIYSGDKVTKFYSKDEIVQDDLITDIKGKVSSSELPLGKYKIVEAGAFDRRTGEEIKNYKYHIIDGMNEKTITLSPAEQTVKIVYGDVEQRNDGIPEVGTTAKDSQTGDSEAAYSETQTIVDTVKYAKLEPGKQYTVKGILMDAETGKPLLVNGKEVTSEKTFVATDYDGTIDIEFTVDSTKLSGKTVVVFEDLYRYKTKVAAHADITDKGQTITYPEVRTTAKDPVTESHMGERSETAVIIDTVSYSNVIPGKTYTAFGYLMNKETGKVIEQDGKPVTAQTDFTPETSEGTFEMRFELDSTVLEGTTTVVFEDLYRNGIKVGSHSDINDDGQSIEYPKVSTTAKDSETKDNQGHTATKVTIIDKVKYEKLEVGREYKVTGILMNKETNSPLLVGDKPVMSELVFTAEKSEGTVEVTFEVDSTVLEETTTVVFETLYTEGIELATHADINDEGQSVHWSRIRTMAKDAKTESHKGSHSRFSKIVDSVSYTNLIPGKEYTVKGVLMNKKTNKPILINGKEVTAEKTFVPKEANGTVKITFHLDSSALEKKTIVVFEDLYHKGIKVTSHADINDKDQSIEYPEKPETPDTGDKTNIFIYGSLALGSAAALALLIRRRKKHADEDNE